MSPLIKSKSKKAFESNMKTEMTAGKPQDQALAISYSMQRRAKKKKMAEGGPVTVSEDAEEYDPYKEDFSSGKSAPNADPSPSPKSITDAIMQKRKMAEGGMVDLDELSEEEPNEYDELNEEAAGKELYDDAQPGPDPIDSNEEGDDTAADAHDMVSMIRRKMMAKRGR